jgi:hypothetical protein
VLAGTLLIANVLGVVGWIWDWQGHLNGVTLQAAHIAIDLGALAIVLALVVAARRTSFRSASLISYVLLTMVALVVLGPMVLMGLYSRSTAAATLMQAYMGSLRTTGGILFALPLLVLALWAAWLWLRAGAFEGWRVAVAGGLAVLAVGVLVDVYWHQTHPMVTDTGAYMNTLTLPGHQLQLLGFTIGCVGAVLGISSWRARRT